MIIGKFKILIFFVVVFISFKNIYHFFDDKEPKFEITTKNILLRDLNVDIKVILTESSNYNLPKERVFIFVDKGVVHKVKPIYAEFYCFHIKYKSIDKESCIENLFWHFNGGSERKNRIKLYLKDNQLCFSYYGLESENPLGFFNICHDIKNKPEYKCTSNPKPTRGGV